MPVFLPGDNLNGESAIKTVVQQNGDLHVEIDPLVTDSAYVDSSSPFYSLGVVISMVPRWMEYNNGQKTYSNGNYADSGYLNILMNHIGNYNWSSALNISLP